MVVPNQELPVLEALIKNIDSQRQRQRSFSHAAAVHLIIRNRLTALKKDRTEYIRAKDVLDIYSSLMTQVNNLNDIRAPPSKASTSEGEASTSSSAEEPTPAEWTQENRVDTTLNDVFQLLSLFFLTIGKSRESPATYSQLATMKRLLSHLTESGVFTEADLKPFQKRLLELKEIIVTGCDSDASPEEGKREEGLTRLLMNKWNDCDRMLQSLVASLSQLSPELAPVHQRLITLRRLLASIAARPRPTAGDVANILTELRAIEDKRVNGKFIVERLASDGETIETYEPPKGQQLVAGLLEDNFDICQDIAASEGSEDVARGPLQPIYDRLSEMRAQLERLVLTHRWTLRETDLYSYQIALQDVDRMRGKDGKFHDSEGNIPRGQIAILFILRRCYGLLYRLVSSSEPISEELMPIANKLETVKRCLLELMKYPGPYSARDLYPFQMSLAQVEGLKSDGQFKNRDGECVDGQAALFALEHECHELISILRTMDEE
ncbi:BZ3500_MvSof-1268-A1-R1_Chr2-2g04950 [Microbotryum saponariae]|uniref:BZ3500_MvSof-1268-A1-R1_Chr2-2g04950 protein n=1 Tax=Microbotryum saponariae TaxID=289078 RepID=A0A2X0N6W8_9BASI|nr:BZ3500_MvSof-1268-A1-R1_Chr2-2g04950 [Microbotryum saponariae]SDA00547.1 BZ3501_MvSof-1269-A2-R1_Chr2-2g04624 [Microbotryum saponariae]